MDNYYNQISSGYNNLYREEQNKKSAFAFSEYKLGKIADDIRSSKLNVIDIGCGTGVSSLNLIRELDKTKHGLVRFFLIDPSQGLLDKIIIIEKGEMLYDPRTEDPEFTVIDLNEFENDYEITIMNIPGEVLDQLAIKFDFIFSLTALQNADELDKILKWIKIQDTNYIISYLHARGDLDEIKEKFSVIEPAYTFSDNKDIFFVR